MQYHFKRRATPTSFKNEYHQPYVSFVSAHSPSVFFFCLIQSKRKGLDILVGVGIGVDIDARVHPSVSLSCLTLCDPMDSSPPGSSV